MLTTSSSVQLEVIRRPNMVELPTSREDAAPFTTRVQAIVRGLATRYQPEYLITVRIRDWFGPKWVGYTAGTPDAAGEHKPQISLPPFVPNRVLQQDRFHAPAYERVDAGPTLARRTLSADVHSLHARAVVPNTVLCWYNDGSAVSGQGALLVYVPRPETWWVWYVGWKSPEWHPTTLRGISRAELSDLDGIAAA